MKPRKPSRDSHALKCEMAAEVLRSSGKLRLRVTGWSMLPSVWPGDTLLIERAEGKSVKEGEIVLYGRDRRLFAHRVVKDSGAADAPLVTRGDAMTVPDAPVGRDELLGKVAFIVRNGKCIEPSKTLRLPERIMASVVRRSSNAARIVVGVHGWRQSSRSQAN